MTPQTAAPRTAPATVPLPAEGTCGAANVEWISALELALLVVSARPDEAATLPAEALAWVEATGPAQTIAIHGAAIAWAPGRAALLVEPTRCEAVRAALIEFGMHDRDLRELEAEVAAGWADLESDAPLAFDFRDRDAERRAGLGERFRRLVALRARLVRLVPHLDRPPLHPPTLASQVGERLRERARMAERAGHLGTQLELHERVYDLCGQRASEWSLAHRSRGLEWAVVVLLAVETALILVDLLASRGS